MAGLIGLSILHSVTIEQVKHAPYVEGRELFVDWCSKMPSAIPIEFGTVKQPGLSDIDIGVVFKEDYLGQDFDLRGHLDRFPQKTKDLMHGGTLMFFPEDVFNNIGFIDDIDARALAGSINLKKLSDDEKSIIDLIQIIEWLPERVAKIYIEANKPNRDAKAIIGALYSLCYSLDKIQSHAGVNYRIKYFVENVHRLRDKWGTILGMALLDNLLASYEDVFAEAVNDITPILQNDFYIDNESRVGYNIYGNVNFISGKNIGVEERNGSIYVTVPSVFLSTYMEYSYSCNTSLLAGSILDRMSNVSEVAMSDRVTHIFRLRAQLLSSLFNFAYALNCGTGLYKFGWYL